MSRKGEAWIDSAQKRRLETFIIGPVVPAAGAVAVLNRFRPIAHEVPRSLYPGNIFTTRKLGDPARDTLMLRWLRRAMLDELPQVLDVRAGMMSLIGPRADEPEHIEQLFDAIENADLRDRWEYVRAHQKPGIISSYAIHSHRDNLAGIPESSRYSQEETRTINANLRATMDIADFGAASFWHDLSLMEATAGMAISNYARYAQNAALNRPQPSAGPAH